MHNSDVFKVFGPVWGASGVQGFFGEGYWYQKLFARWIPGYSFESVTFVAKTATAYPVVGNMPLALDGISPRDRRPACIKAGFWQVLWGVMLNAVGLSNRGIDVLVASGRWHALTDPFMISIMTVGATLEERELELRRIKACIANLTAMRASRVAIQLNVSCPNTARHSFAARAFVSETFDALSLIASLGVPVFVKFNVLTNVQDAREISRHPACAGIIISNTLPWDAMPTWMRLLFFGSIVSPLTRFGGGGLSGWPLRRRINKWIRAAREAGIEKHINAGGGIFGPFGAWSAKRAGANSISLGSIAAVRPWMLGPTAAFAHWLFNRNINRRRISS